MLRKLLLVGAIFLVWMAALAFGLLQTPTGFVPDEDKGVMMVNVQLPDASSLTRTKAAMDKVAVSRAVDRLVKSQRLSRHSDREDRRRSRLRLTRQGRAVYAEVVPAALALEQRLLATLGAEDRLELDRLLKLLSEAAQQL